MERDTDAGLPYDPYQVYASVEDWTRKLCRDYARRVGRPHLGDDLIAELQLAVWERLVLGKYDPSRSMPTTYVGVQARGFLRSLVENMLAPVRLPRSVRSHKSTGRRGKTHLGADENRRRAEQALAGTVQVQDWDEELAAENPGLEQVDQGDEFRRVAKLMERELEPREREVIQLCVMEGLRLRDAAEVMGISFEYVRQIKVAALAKLRVAMGVIPRQVACPQENEQGERTEGPNQREFFAAGAANGWDILRTAEQFGLHWDAARSRAYRLSRKGLWPKDAVPPRSRVAELAARRQ